MGLQRVVKSGFQWCCSAPLRSCTTVMRKDAPRWVAEDTNRGFYLQLHRFSLTLHKLSHENWTKFILTARRGGGCFFWLLQLIKKHS